MIVYKPKKSHKMVDALSKIFNREPAINVED